jgi:hypothetical protein
VGWWAKREEMSIESERVARRILRDDGDGCGGDAAEARKWQSYRDEMVTTMTA